MHRFFHPTSIWQSTRACVSHATPLHRQIRVSTHSIAGDVHSSIQPGIDGAADFARQLLLRAPQGFPKRLDPKGSIGIYKFRLDPAKPARPNLSPCHSWDVFRWILDKTLSFHNALSRGIYLSSSQEPLKGAISRMDIYIYI